MVKTEKKSVNLLFVLGVVFFGLGVLFVSLPKVDAFCTVQVYITNSSGDYENATGVMQCTGGTGAGTYTHTNQKVFFDMIGGLSDDCNAACTSIYANATTVVSGEYGEITDTTPDTPNSNPNNWDNNLTTSPPPPPAAPSYSGITPTSDYSYSTSSHNYDSVWTAGSGSISEVIFSSDYTGSWINYTLSGGQVTNPSGSTYRYSMPSLAAGTTVHYFWWANQSTGQNNMTSSYTIIVQKATPSVNINVNNTAPANGETVNISCTGTSGLTLNLYDGSSNLLTSGTSPISATKTITSSETFVCNTTGNQNYTSNSDSQGVIVGATTLTFDVNIKDFSNSNEAGGVIIVDAASSTLSGTGTGTVSISSVTTNGGLVSSISINETTGGMYIYYGSSPNASAMDNKVVHLERMTAYDNSTGNQTSSYVYYADASDYDALGSGVTGGATLYIPTSESCAKIEVCSSGNYDSSQVNGTTVGCANNSWTTISSGTSSSGGYVSISSPSWGVYRVSSGSCTAGSSGGCFDGKTKILTPRGNVEIEKLKVGDKVVSYDLVNKRRTEGTIEKIYVYDRVGYYLINNKIKVTAEHPFFVKRGIFEELGIKTGVWREVKDLKIGDLLSNGERVRSIKFVNELNRVYNLLVSGEHNYYANGVLVHNKGGGGSSGTATYTLYYVDVYKGVNVKLMKTQYISFELKKPQGDDMEWHRLTVDDIDYKNQKVKITVHSDSQEFEFTSGSKNLIDVYGNGEPDLEVIVNSIGRKYVSLYLKSVVKGEKKASPPEPAMSPPTEEKKSFIQTIKESIKENNSYIWLFIVALAIAGFIALLIKYREQVFTYSKKVFKRESLPTTPEGKVIKKASKILRRN